jgi:excisionase family DNA binding protein
MSSGGLNLDALIDAIAERVAERLRAGSSSESGTVRPRLLSVAQAAQYLGRSRESVEHLIAAGKIPTVRIDRRVFLDLIDLDRLIEDSKMGTI